MKYFAIVLLLTLPAQAHSDAIGAAIISAVVSAMQGTENSPDNPSTAQDNDDD